MAKVTLQTNELRSDDGSRIVVKDGLMAYEDSPALSSMDGGDLVCKDNLIEFLPDVITPLIFTLSTSDPAPYTLTSPQLASVNQYSKYPNFVAIIGGEVFNDITPVYTGSVGAFTQIQIKLHNDGSGNNADVTTVQFS